jgi:hypothetical protein
MLQFPGIQVYVIFFARLLWRDMNVLNFSGEVRGSVTILNVSMSKEGVAENAYIVVVDNGYICSIALRIAKASAVYTEQLFKSFH